ncbi:MAG: hypothetical protein IJD92_02430 [Bacilli bacterium]|nr:hypothetical protein [Bacilli bacterium]
MKLDKVFVAFLKSDDKEHLLYRKEADLYFDLNTKEKYTSKDIDLNTLIYLKDTISIFCDNMLKFNIKKLYNNDRKKLIDTSDLIIADINKVSDLEIITLDNNYKQYKWNAKFLNKALLQMYTSHSYEDIRNKRVYIGELANMFINGCVYVSDGKNTNIKYLRYENLNLSKIEKGKALELSYKLSKGEKI